MEQSVLSGRAVGSESLDHFFPEQGQTPDSGMPLGAWRSCCLFGPELMLGCLRLLYACEQAEAVPAPPGSLPALRDSRQSRLARHFFPAAGRRGRCRAEIDLMISLRRAAVGMGTLARFKATFTRLSTSGSPSTLASGWPASYNRILRTTFPVP